MARLVPAFEQFFDSSGNPLVSGKLFFYESGSSTLEKETFANADNTISNANPVILNGDGRAPDIFGGGSYRVVLTDANNVQIVARDPVGGETGTTFGADWNAESTYGIADVIREDNRYWISQTSNNRGNRPSTDSGANWVIWPEVQPINPNILINGDPLINQRVFDGNWAALSDGDYGWDRWKKLGSNMVQVVESRNFIPSTEYTLSGDGVTTTTLTSPASGNWDISVPQTATNIKLDYGRYATVFIPDDAATNLVKCQRYYEKSYNLADSPGTISSTGVSAFSARSGSTQHLAIDYKVTKNKAPSIAIYSPITGATGNVRNDTQTGDASFSPNTSGGNKGIAQLTGGSPVPSAGDLIRLHWVADSEL